VTRLSLFSLFPECWKYRRITIHLYMETL
jgi:hypothetical protein